MSGWSPARSAMDHSLSCAIVGLPAGADLFGSLLALGHTGFPQPLSQLRVVVGHVLKSRNRQIVPDREIGVGSQELARRRTGRNHVTGHSRPGCEQPMGPRDIWMVLGDVLRDRNSLSRAPRARQRTGHSHFGIERKWIERAQR